jgi:hypothetical protein
LLFGRTLDLYSYDVLDELSLVTVRRPQGRRAYATVGIAGLFAVIAGMNEAGVALATMDAGPAKDGSTGYNPQGVPVHATASRILEECTSVEEAEQLVRSLKHSRRMSLVVCDARRAVVFEVTSKNVVLRHPEDHLLACTNQFRTPELSLSTDCERYEILRSNRTKREPFTRYDVGRILQKVGEAALQRMIFEPGSLKLHVAVGEPATADRMATLDLAELFQHKASGR